MNYRGHTNVVTECWLFSFVS